MNFTLIVNCLEYFNPKTNRRDSQLICDNPVCQSDRFEIKCTIQDNSIIQYGHILICASCGKEFDLTPCPSETD